MNTNQLVSGLVKVVIESSDLVGNSGKRLVDVIELGVALPLCNVPVHVGADAGGAQRHEAGL